MRTGSTLIELSSFVTGRNEIVAKVMFLLMSVILLTRGVSASVHAGIQTPLEQTPPPRADTHLPSPGSRLRHTVNERPVRILLECILVFTLFQPQKTVEEKSISRREEETVEAAEDVNSQMFINVSQCRCVGACYISK